MDAGTVQGEATAVEIMNAGKIVNHLSALSQYAYRNLREDIFVVTDIDSGQECVVDVEESIVCIRMDICDAPENMDKRMELFELLLAINSRTIHGRYEASSGKVLFKDHLEIENLDQNELEASLRWAFGVVGGSIEQIAEIIQS